VRRLEQGTVFALHLPRFFAASVRPLEVLRNS
jgi:hypothetical protein